MLLLLAWWATLLIAALPLGATLTRLCRHGLAREDRFVVQSFLGLAALSAILLALSFFTAISPPVALIALAASAALWIPPSVREEFQFPAGSRWSLVGIMAASAWNASGPVMLYDTGLYHYPLTRWLAEAGTIPGMALLHFRLGFTSSWLATAAATDWGPWRGYTSGVTGGLLMAILVFQFTVSLRRLSGGEVSASDRFLIASCPLFFLFMIVQRQQASPSPNLPIAAGVLITGWLLAHSVRERNLAVIAAGLTIPLKLQAAPALAIALAARFASGKGWWKLLAAAAVLSSPLPIANFISTGCPFFPATIACIESPSSMGFGSVRYFMRDTLYWARYYGHWNYDATFFSLDWIPRWLGNPWNWVFAGVCIIGIWGAWKTRHQFPWSGAIGLAGSAYVMISAPDLRFAIGYVSLLLGLIGAAYSNWTRLISWVPARSWAAAAISFLLLDAVGHEAAYYYILHAKNAAFQWERVLIASPIPSGLPFTQNELNGVHYRTSKAQQCWGIERPCVPPDSGLEPTLHFCDPIVGERAGYCK
jgi:hypothetical protein